MENKEIEKFKLKSSFYKKAINGWPSGRMLEIFPILSSVEGYLKSYNLKKEKTTIIDLMSGNGYLSQYLLDYGFKNIHAIEACNEMSYDAEIYNSPSVKLHPVPDITQIDRLLNDIRPQIIVSLASFHHLIVYNNGDINRQKSIELQFATIQACLNALPADGMLLITDLFEDGALHQEKTDNFFWHPVEFKFLTNSFLDKKIIKSMVNSSNINDYSYFIQDKLCKSHIESNPSLNWFRNVVNEKTFIGHNDVALSTDLLEKLSDYSTEFKGINCPWLFKSKPQMIEFLSNKFGFAMDNNIDPPELEELAEKTVGISQIQGDIVSFGWCLGMVKIQKRQLTTVINPISSWIITTTIILFNLGLVLYIAIQVFGIMDRIENTVEQVLYILFGSLVIEGIAAMSKWIKEKNST